MLETLHRTLRRRHYTIGRCQDCGHTTKTTIVTFWVSGLRYRVCSSCARAYRGVVLKPCSCER